MIRKSRHVAWLAGLLGLWTLLSACRAGDTPAPGPAPGGSESAAEPGPIKAASLSLLTWEGYADAKITKEFEQQYAVTIKHTYFTSSDELVAKLKAGGSSYDVISPLSDVAATLVQTALVQPIDVSRLASYKDLSKVLVEMPDVQKDGHIYGVPFTWGPDYLVYDADVIKEEPKSWNIFFDPSYSGKVSLWDDITSLSLMGQLLGFDKADKAVLYQMTEEQLEIAKKKLIELRPHIRTYWATAGDLNELFKKKEVVVSMGWPITRATLNKQGMNLKGVIPEEGATGWIDRLMIPTSSKNKALAEQYISHVTRPEVMAIVASVTRASVANPLAVKHMTDDVKKETEAERAEEYLKKLNFRQPVPNRKRYGDVWNEVKGAK
jgi:putative spermidine/putrescine transport system substrate-binding protein/spermidine/putrescine transport system substrate-binding protein